MLVGSPQDDKFDGVDRLDLAVAKSLPWLFFLAGRVAISGS
jgi:hypothetical protein